MSTEIESRSGIEHFWTPPQPGEQILGMTRYEDMIVVATTCGIYVITPEGRALPPWDIHKITSSTVKEWR